MLLGQQEGGPHEPLPGSVLGKTWRERSLWKGLLERARGTGALHEEEVVADVAQRREMGKWRECRSPRGPRLGKEDWPHMPFQEHGHGCGTEPRV